MWVIWKQSKSIIKRKINNWGGNIKKSKLKVANMNRRIKLKTWRIIKWK